MGRSSREVSKRKKEGVKGEKSACFLVYGDTEIGRTLNPHRIIVQNPATGQDLCTYVPLRFSSPRTTFSIMVTAV